MKVLILPWQLDDAERNDFRARFLREAETQQRLLRHPHIVTVLAYGEDAASGADLHGAALPARRHAGG